MATLVVDCNYSASGNNTGSKVSGAGSLQLGDAFNDSSDPVRPAFRFDISGIPAGSTVTNVALQIECSDAGGDSWRLGPYNLNGQADPQPDSGATIFSRCNISSDNYLTGFTDFLSTGSKTFSNLGSAANADVEAAISGGIFTLCFEQTQTGSFAWAGLTDHTGTDKPTLTVTYTAPAGGSGTQGGTETDPMEPVGGWEEPVGPAVNSIFDKAA